MPPPPPADSPGELPRGLGPAPWVWGSVVTASPCALGERLCPETRTQASVASRAQCLLFSVVATL